MADSWLIEAATSRWAVGLIAFALGAVSARHLWPRMAAYLKEGAEDGPALAEGETAPAASESNDGAPPQEAAAKTLGELDKELAELRLLVEAESENSDALSKVVSDLDDAVKRANGRLKLMIKSIERGDQ